MEVVTVEPDRMRMCDRGAMNIGAHETAPVYEAADLGDPPIDPHLDYTD
jgi:hypothetical protein